MRPPGETALTRAIWLWSEDIIDPRRGDTRPSAVRSMAAIDRLIRGPNGLGWSSARDGGRTVGNYTGDGSFPWCGAFWAYCWSGAGLAKGIRLAHCASTSRLRRWSEGNARRVAVEDVRQGDAVIVGHRDRVNGDHIAMAAGPLLAGWVQTVEGNAIGLGPDGKRREGVVRSQRSTAEIRFIVRPLPEDLDPLTKEP